MHLKNLITWTNHVPWSSTTCLLEEVLVQTPLRGHLCRVVVWADSELEKAHVVGRQLYPHLDGLTTDVPPDKNALPIHATSFIVARLFTVPRVSADSAFATVGSPLSGEATAIQLMVVVVRFGLETVPPHCGP